MLYFNTLLVPAMFETQGSIVLRVNVIAERERDGEREREKKRVKRACDLI